MKRPPKVPDVESELEGADFGDERLGRRLTRIASTVATAPAESFPQLAGTDGELEGVYRFLSNERVTAEKILAPHIEATCGRAAARDVLVLHDTTSFTFRQGSRVGLGHLHRTSRQGKSGFYGHFAFATTADGTRRPIGVVGLRTFVRTGNPLTKAVTGYRRFKRTKKESARWPDAAIETSRVLPRSIHVMDREGDSYETYRLLKEAGVRFVIRARTGWERKTESNGSRGTYPEVAKKTPIRLKRTVELSRRAPTTVGVLRKAHPPRNDRTAQLHVYAAPLQMECPHNYGRDATTDRGPLTVNVVYVDEPNPPPGQEPVSWMLITTEPIETKDQVETIVDHYRARWTIEEFFKALKTGCAFEKRQLETYAALRNALAVFSVVAWRLLLLRTVSRDTPSAPAENVATARQLRLLRSLKRVDHPRVRGVELPKHATAHDVLLAVAKLGGHLKQNGPPGWQVLGRGYDSLLLLEVGWIAREEM
jgi:IS4 transposase